MKGGNYMGVNIESAKKDKIEIYIDQSGEWRWTRTCTINGKIVGASSEGYKNKQDSIDNANRQFIDCEVIEKD